jgi:hypothetical protein
MWMLMVRIVTTRLWRVDYGNCSLYHSWGWRGIGNFMFPVIVSMCRGRTDYAALSPRFLCYINGAYVNACVLDIIVVVRQIQTRMTVCNARRYRSFRLRSLNTAKLFSLRGWIADTSLPKSNGDCNDQCFNFQGWK